MRAIIYATLIFVTCSFVGPSIRLIMWILSAAGGSPSGVYRDFIYLVILFLWPTQPLAVLEASTSPLVGVAVAVAANVAMFSIIGLISGLVSIQARLLGVVYLVVCAAVLSMVFWSAGFTIKPQEFLAVGVAFFVYGVAFMLVWRYTSRGVR